jgi:hypothetical protein
LSRWIEALRRAVRATLNALKKEESAVILRGAKNLSWISSTRPDVQSKRDSSFRSE